MMETKVKDFEDLYNSVCNDNIVYLFGTGISSALTGKEFSWKRWIQDGISYIRDIQLVEQWSGKIGTEASTNEIIDIAGKVIATTKSDGTYSKWMSKSFESNAITNNNLALTLKKLLIGNDVFVTTNYDTLLEQATGLETCSYENPDRAFAMLDEKKNTYVLHIHGVYDSSNDIDNIIADKDQYDKIMGDEGAQFIQHILGTRTLIFIGCGKTTEDVNISKFIEFAGRFLNLSRKYFFLYKDGEKPSNIPDSILPIRYGEHYSDLPMFLEDIAQTRLRALMKTYPIIGRIAYENRIYPDDPLLQYHYSNEVIPFCGREDELSRLGDFLTVKGKFKWWALTGQAGAGKSRLALEFLKRMPTPWFGFFLNDNIKQADIVNFIPFSDTFVVIDYVSGRESIVADSIRLLSELFDNSTYLLRILLIERENNREVGSWYGKLIQRFGKYNNIPKQEYKQEFLNITDMDDTSVEHFIGMVCEHKQVLHDPANDNYLRKVYWAKFENLRYRPLYVQMFVEAWIDNDFTIPRYDSFENLLSCILKREQERWLRSLNSNQECCNAFVRLLLRANVSGELRIDNIPDYYKKDWRRVRECINNHTFSGKQRSETQKSIVNDVCQNVDSHNSTIAPMFPDIIKEFMFFFYADEEHLAEVVQELWENTAHKFSIFITRCRTDFPQNDFYTRILKQGNTKSENAMMGRLELLKKRKIHNDDDPFTLISIIYDELGYWRSVEIPTEDPEKAKRISLLKFTGLNLVATQLGGWCNYDVTPMIEVIDESLCVPDGEALSMIKMDALHHHIINLSAASFFNESSYLKSKLEDLTKTCPDDEFSALIHTNNGNVEMMNCILTGDFPNAAAVLEKMEKECDLTSLESARTLSHSCYNFDHFACATGKTNYLGKGYKISKRLEGLYPNDWCIRARTIGCHAMDLQSRFLINKSVPNKQLSYEIDVLEKRLSTMSFGKDEKCSEALELSWASVKTLKINIIHSNAEELKKLIAEADEILRVNPNLSDVVRVKIIALHVLHTEALGNKVSLGEVEDAFKYVEICHDSAVVREAFFNMLDDSDVADKRKNYMTEPVVRGAIQDARYNSLMGSGIPEIDDTLDMLEDFAIEEYIEPIKRWNRKIGRNDPCPCGSGKKFKKCCMGKGIYD